MLAPMRVGLNDIDSSSWEHPADRAALRALRAVPGLDHLLRKTVGFVGEQGIRLMFQANAVQVGPRQFPRVHRAYEQVMGTLDVQTDIPIFVSQSPLFNAGAYGMDQPFIVLNSGALDLLEDEELPALVGHEVGHVVSGHALYHTMLALIVAVGVRRLPVLADIGLLPIRLALLEWSRKSELSSDRAALLATQDVQVVLQLFLRSAGGVVARRSELDLDSYMEQVRKYEAEGGLSMLFKVLNLLDATHPFHTARAGEIATWHDSAEYRAILAGQYRRRGDAAAPEVTWSEDARSAGDHYAAELRTAVGNVTDAAKGAVSDVAEAAQAALSRLRR
jgi:Zn-dependent protease with chaperone function